MPTEYLTPQIEDRAIELQGILSKSGHHRAPSIPDLLIAATAELRGLAVLAHDKDFKLISEITNQKVAQLSDLL
jgi:predicted nucleic acid-binding protein